MKKIITIELEACCPHVSEAQLGDHLNCLADDIKHYAKSAADESYNRKIQISYDEQEDINLATTTKTEDG